MEMKNVFRFLTMFTLPASMVFSSGCKSVREFGNGVYYNESDSSIYLAVSDCKDTPDSPEFDKQCKLQFSDNFDVSYIEEEKAYVYAMFHWSDSVDDAENLSEEEENKLFEQAEKEYLDHVDLKKQFVDNDATFYYVQEEGENTAVLYAYVDGSDFYDENEEKDIVTFDIDENGTLILSYDMNEEALPLYFK